MADHRRPPGYAGGRDWQWRMLLGAAVGSASGVICASLASAVVPSLRGSLGQMATNAAVASVCLAGSEEIVRELRSGEPEDTTNALLGGGISGYALGMMRGGKSLAPSSAIGFSILGVGIHKAVCAIQDWRLRQISRQLMGPGGPEGHAGGEAERNAEGGGRRREWSWPEWLPIRPATSEDIRKQKELEEIRAREAEESAARTSRKGSQ